MLTHQILLHQPLTEQTHRPWPRGERKQQTVVQEYMQQQNILDRQLARCPFKPGMKVMIKGRRKGKNIGRVLNLIDDANACGWRKNNTQPVFIVVGVQTNDPVNSEIELYPLKMLNVAR